MTHSRRHVPALIAGIILIIILAVVAQRASAPKGSTPGGDESTKSTQAAFNKNQHSVDQAGSLWWVVNKTRPVGADYAPTDLVVPTIPIRPGSGTDERRVSKRIVPDLEAMVAAGNQAGARLMQASGYRSYRLQQSVYAQNVRSLGQAEADRVSAKPGTSEHQTGLALDVEPASRECEIEVCFGDMAEGKWLAEHAHEFGFIIRYPEDKESVTGYSYEPWHIRYVGRELAAEMKKQNISTMEEFFGL